MCDVSCSSPKGRGGGKSDQALDSLNFQLTPLKGRSPLQASDFSSPRGSSLFCLKDPPLPIFQPSPKRPSDAASTYLASPTDSIRRRPNSASGLNFPLSPVGIASPINGSSCEKNNGTTIQSAFAAILDGHSRISPTNLSRAAAAPHGECVATVRERHFSSLFPSSDATIGVKNIDVGDNTTNHRTGHSYDFPRTANVVSPRNGIGGCVPSDVGSPLQLRAPRGEFAANQPSSRRPSLRRALNFNTTSAGVESLHSKDAILQSPIDPMLPIASLKGGSENEINASIEEEELYGNEKMYYSPPGRPYRIPQVTNGFSAASSDFIHETTGDKKAIAHVDERSGSPQPLVQSSSLASLARSPVSMRPGITRRDIIDSPAVKEATNAAVKAALEANARTRLIPVNASPIKLESSQTNMTKRPQRAAAAGAAAATAVVAASTSTGLPPRRSSSMRSTSSSAAQNAALAAALPTGTKLNGSASENSGFVQNAVDFIAPPGSLRCNCKKSRCLKLYCDCFKANTYCGVGCSCIGCYNREDNVATVIEAREAILTRNPHAFTEKIAESTTSQGNMLAQHRKGCNCKKSRCLKKYCECFHASVPCGDHCKCENCCNTLELAAAGKVPYKNPPTRLSTSSIVSPASQENLTGPSPNPALNCHYSIGTKIGGNVASVGMIAAASSVMSSVPTPISTAGAGLVPITNAMMQQIKQSQKVTDIARNGLPLLTPVPELLGPSLAEGFGGNPSDNSNTKDLYLQARNGSDEDSYHFVTSPESNKAYTNQTLAAPSSVEGHNVRRSSRRSVPKVSSEYINMNDDDEVDNQLDRLESKKVISYNITKSVSLDPQNRSVRLTPKKRKPIRTSTSAAM